VQFPIRRRRASDLDYGSLGILIHFAEMGYLEVQNGVKKWES
jgi:hypothetical protein